MEAWIGVAIAAAFAQNVRSGAQRQMNRDIGATAAAYARFPYALPIPLLCLIWLLIFDRGALPTVSLGFFGFIAMSGLAQIMGTLCLVRMFSTDNFAVGTTLSKTEALIAAFFGTLLLGEALELPLLFGAITSCVGILFIASVKGLFGAASRKLITLGLLSGMGFALGAVGFRGAILSLDGGTPVGRCLLAISIMLTLQTVLVLSLLRLNGSGSGLGALVRAWRIGFVVGVASLLATVGWFFALSWQETGYVRAVAQVELVFALITSYLVFGERATRQELFGIALIVAGVLLALLGSR